MYAGSRGVVGLVKPTYRPGMLESFIRSMPAQVWAAQKRLHIRAPVSGYGRLLAEMP